MSLCEFTSCHEPILLLETSTPHSVWQTVVLKLRHGALWVPRVVQLEVEFLGPNEEKEFNEPKSETWRGSDTIEVLGGGGGGWRESGGGSGGASWPARYHQGNQSLVVLGGVWFRELKLKGTVSRIVILTSHGRVPPAGHRKDWRMAPSGFSGWCCVVFLSWWRLLINYGNHPDSDVVNSYFIIKVLIRIFFFIFTPRSTEKSRDFLSVHTGRWNGSTVCCWVWRGKLVTLPWCHLLVRFWHFTVR